MIFTVLNIMILVFFCIYWCINEKIAFQLCIVILLSSWSIHLLNSLKLNFLANIQFEWFVMAFFFCVYLFLRKKMEALLVRGGYRVQMIVTAVVSFSLIIYHPNLYFVISSGVLLGLGLGYCLNKKYISFDCANLLQRKGIKKYLTLLARLALGVSILLVMVYRVEKIIFGMSESQNIYLYGFLCYTLIGFWITIAAPWLFIKLNLAGIALGNDDSDAEKKPEQKYGKHWFSN